MSRSSALRKDGFPAPVREPARPLALVQDVPSWDEGGLLIPEQPTVEHARSVLHRYWGYQDFRPAQKPVLASVLEGRDVLAVLPTGAGKSAIYQTAAMLLPGVTLVVSPLISLMQDQIKGLEERGVQAAFINSTLTPRQAEARMRRAEEGEVKLLYVAPERFDSFTFREWIRRVDVSLYAIDEAHCVSTWGHDFRPAYLRLGGQRELIGHPPILAVTATATPRVREDVVEHLGLDDPVVHVGSFDRPNLAWRVVRAGDEGAKDELLRAELRGVEGSAVVYASTQKAVDAVAEMLNGHGLPAVPYHAGKTLKQRAELQEEFMSGRVPIVVATTAFGMGVDKSDVRKVVHYNFPGSIEGYYQEAGRAGRDGGPAECVMLYSPKDASTPEFLLGLSHPTRKTAGFFVVLRRPTEEIRRLLAPESRTDDRHVLRELWRMGGGRRLYRGSWIRARHLDTIQGEVKQVRKSLKRLEEEGVLVWREEVPGTRLLKRDLDPGSLPLPFEALERRREQELAKLRRVMAYAETCLCRRGDLLRYFGDPAAMARCGGCDNCRTPARRRS